MKWEPVFAIGLVAVWFAGIVCVQAVAILEIATRRNLARALWWKKLDVFDLCPVFLLFSALPVSHYHLLYRDQSIGGSISPWNLVSLPARGATRFIWHPDWRKRVALEDMCRSLLSHVGRELWKGATPSPFCFPYVALANYVAQIPACPLSSARQFMIAQSRTIPEQQPEVLFVSPLFSLRTNS